MKKILIASLLAAAAAVPFSANAQGYIGLGVGQANNSLDDAGLTAVSRSERKTAFKIYGGYNFNPTWGMEVGYADFGTARNVYLIGATNVSLEYNAHSLYIAGTGTLPLNKSFSLNGKLGLAANRASATASGAGITANASGNKASVLIGVGASWQFADKVALTLDYDNFGRTAQDARADMWSLGLRMKF
jgi:OOP family OmpA-OmpF porin